MKHLFFLFLLLIPVANALYGGESFTREFFNCTYVNISIDGDRTIDDEEYNITGKCSEINSNEYQCNCTDGYFMFNMTTQLNTLNEYDITFTGNFTYEEEDLPDDDSPGGSYSGGGGGGSGSSYTKKVITNATNTTKKPLVAFEEPEVEQPQDNQEEPTPTQEPPQPSEVQQQNQEDNSIVIWILIGIVVIVGLGVLAWFVYKDN